MTTSFYLIEVDDTGEPVQGKLLGTRVGIGNKQTKFVWASSPLGFMFHGHKPLNDVVINENGHTYNLAMFFNHIHDCLHDFTKIGDQ